MKIPFKSIKLYNRMLLSYLFILCIPFIIIYSFLYTSFIDMFTGVVEKSLGDRLGQVQTSFDNVLLESTKIMRSMQLNTHFSVPYLINASDENNILQSMSVMNELKNYAAANTAIKDIIVYVNETKTVFNTNGRIKEETYFTDYYSEEGVTNTLRNELGNNSDNIVLPTKNIYLSDSPCKVIQLKYILGNSEMKENVSVVFFLDVKVIENYFSNKLDGIKGILALLNADGEPILITPEKTLPEKVDWQELVTAVSDGIKTKISLDGREYLASCKWREYKKVSAFLLLPYDDVIKDVIHIHKKAVGVFLIILFIEIFLVSISIKINFMPINWLKESLIHLVGDKHNTEDEISYIGRAVSDVVEKNNLLARSIQEIRPAARHSVLYSLLMGPVREWGDLKALVSTAGIIFQFSNFFIAIIEFNKRMEHQERERFKSELKINKEDLKCYIVDIFDHYKIPLIFSCVSEDISVVLETIEQIKNFAKEKYGIIVTIGVSGVCNDIMQLSQSYLQAMSAVEYGFVLGEGNTILYNDIISSNQYSLWYPKEEMQEVEKLMDVMDIEGVRSKIKDIFIEIKNRKVPVYVAKCIAYDVINFLIRVMFEMKIDLTEFKHKYFNTVAMTEFKYISELEAFTNTFMDDVSEIINIKKDKRKTDFINRIIGYIEKEYYIPEFSIDYIARELNVSSGYLMRYFKEQKNITILEYVTELRIKKAQELLRETDMSIKAIAVDVGYLEVITFNRNFKKLVKMNPGNYRSVNQ